MMNLLSSFFGGIYAKLAGALALLFYLWRQEVKDRKAEIIKKERDIFEREINIAKNHANKIHAIDLEMEKQAKKQKIADDENEKLLRSINENTNSIDVDKLRRLLDPDLTDDN